MIISTRIATAIVLITALGSSGCLTYVAAKDEGERSGRTAGILVGAIVLPGGRMQLTAADQRAR